MRKMIYFLWIGVGMTLSIIHMKPESVLLPIIGAGCVSLIAPLRVWYLKKFFDKTDLDNEKAFRIFIITTIFVVIIFLLVVYFLKGTMLFQNLGIPL